MFRNFGTSYKPEEELKPNLREVAREISLKTQVYVTPEELTEITSLIPDYQEWDFDLTDNGVPQSPEEPIVKEGKEFYFYFFAQTSTTTVLCQVVMDMNEHVRYNVKKIEW